MDMKKGVKIDFKEIQKKIKEFFNKVIEFIKNLPETIKNAPNDEKAAYGAVGLGFILFVTGIVMIVVA